MKPTLNCACGEQNRVLAFQYDAPPEGEARFQFEGAYTRRYEACRICGHFFGAHDFDLSKLYEGAYVDATYQSSEGIAKVFNRIVSLPPERSDNAGRSARIDAFAKRRYGSSKSRTLLDVGAGLGVFPYAMRNLGWNVTALDPDSRAAQHIETTIGVSTIVGDFLKVETERVGQYDAITFNKVLEHIEDPTSFLDRARSLLKPQGFIYIEVPDVAAAAEGPGREEFFIDHHHVFSLSSLTHLIEIAKLEVIRIERIREPSTKFTLFAFAQAKGA